MRLHVKNMVCNRCIMAVESVLEELGLPDYNVTMGIIEYAHKISDKKRKQLEIALQNLGFEVIEDKKSKIIEAIKNLIIQKVHHETLEDQKFSWSELISRALHYDYKYLSSLFSSVEGTTIEHYVILQKIEKVKELIVYEELTLSEIAWKLGYSSVAHLSNQFKKVTGMPPRAFKEIGAQRRVPLDKV